MASTKSFGGKDFLTIVMFRMSLDCLYMVDHRDGDCYLVG